MKKAEGQRIDASELWCWRRLLRVPWTARRSNQSIVKEISPGISLEGLMLKLKLQYFGHLVRRVDSLEKTLMLGGIGGRRRRGWQNEMAGWHHWLDGHEFEWTPGVGDGQGGPACWDSWGGKKSDTTEQLNWTELNEMKKRSKTNKKTHIPQSQRPKEKAIVNSIPYNFPLSAFLRLILSELFVTGNQMLNCLFYKNNKYIM